MKLKAINDGRTLIALSGVTDDDAIVLESIGWELETPFGFDMTQDLTADDVEIWCIKDSFYQQKKCEK